MAKERRAVSGFWLPAPPTPHYKRAAILPSARIFYEKCMAHHAVNRRRPVFPILVLEATGLF